MELSPRLGCATATPACPPASCVTSLDTEDPPSQPLQSLLLQKHPDSTLPGWHPVVSEATLNDAPQSYEQCLRWQQRQIVVVAQRMGEKKCALRLQLPKEVLHVTCSIHLYKANIHQIVRFPDIHRDDLLTERHKDTGKIYRV